MKRRLLSSILIVAMAFFGAVHGASAQSDDVSNVVAVVTHPNPQVQMLSMVLSVQAAERGLNVHVLLCGPAGDLALKDAPDAVTQTRPPLNISTQAFMTILSQYENATVEVCALYLPGNGKTEADMLDGIGVASPAQMAALLVSQDARVLSF
jgi:predicted peroxiredoxin